MKKTRFMLLALVAALILMGAAYAAWTQSLTITSTVETGELFVKVDNRNTIVEVDKTGNGGYEPADVNINDVVKITGTESRKAGEGTTITKINYTLGNVYPGTRINSELALTNLGTINASASVADITIDNNLLWNALKISVNDQSVAGNTVEEKKADLRNKIEAAIAGLNSNTGSTLRIKQEFPYSSGNETENQTLNWSIIVNFEQNTK